MGNAPQKEKTPAGDDKYLEPRMCSAAFDGNVAEVIRCLDSGAKSVNLAMTAAAQTNQVEVMQVCLQRGADQNAEVTSLLLAASCGHAEAVQFICENRRAIATVTRMRMAARCAQANGHADLAKLCEEMATKE
ncbi:MAG: ankyrin repeat domain-containing protein [Gemmatimonadaceae bacterium]|jgi:hypothetical protein